MRVSEVIVPLCEKARFWTEFQNYLSELATFTAQTRSSSELAYPWFDHYWADSNCRWPFWGKVNGEIAGLALVRRDETDHRIEMSEFYVRPSRRRRGVGCDFARRLFHRFPGEWKLSQVQSNAIAVHFWHGVLDGYVRYTECNLVADVPRLEQRFAIDEAPN
jgi:predicted acetyltransferase